MELNIYIFSSHRFTVSRWGKSEQPDGHSKQHVMQPLHRKDLFTEKIIKEWCDKGML